MLHFFRRYQKFIFLFITIIIVITFAFFGTYQAIAPAFNRKKEKEAVLFRVIDGRKITDKYFSALTEFLKKETWLQRRDLWVNNYLNDGVISSDFIEGKLFQPIVARLGAPFNDELEEKFKQEKGFAPYVHPHIRFLTAENVWAVFAPEISEALLKFKMGMTPQDKFDSRVALFLAQKKFPPAFLAQVLHYQEKDYPNLPADTRLRREELGLFGYKTVEEWFGSQCIEGIAKVIVQIAALARQQGYTISHEEVMDDLLMKSQKVVEALRKESVPISSGKELLQIYMRENNLREKDLVHIWEDISLFRRYLTELGNAALVDMLAVQDFYFFAHETATVEIAQLSSELRFQTSDELKRFEAYLAAVGEKRDSPIDIPIHYLPIDEIQKKAPELVGKRYRLFFAEVSKDSLQSKVTLKETWDWECESAHWEMLKSQFPELAQKEGTPFQILEALNTQERKPIDRFARIQIVSTHPEWIDTMLKDTIMQETELFLTEKSTRPFAGITDVNSFQQALDQKNETTGYSQDQEYFYRFLVQEKSEKPEILSFKKIKNDPCLEQLAKEVDLVPLLDALTAEIPLEGVANEKRGDVYAPYRFAKFLAYPLEGGELAAQWKIETKTKTITRATSDFVSFAEAMALGENISSVKVDPKESAYRYRVIDRKVDKTLQLEKLLHMQTLLAQEARIRCFENLMQKVSL